MSPTSSNAVQAQWELSHTAFKSIQALQALMVNAAKDDASGPVVLAFEQLGAAMLVRKELIAQGYDALGQGKYTFLKIVQLAVGLSGDGIAREFRKSSGCIAALVFVAGCMICYSNEDIAKIVFEIMNIEGILKRIPSSPNQLAQVVEVASGYCQNLHPTDVFHALSEALAPFVVNNHQETAVDQMATIDVATIVTTVFRAIQDEDISRITLEGYVNGVWLAAFFSWILPVDVSVWVAERRQFGGPMIPAKQLLGTGPAKLEIYLNYLTTTNWRIQERKAEAVLSTVIQLNQGRFQNAPKMQLQGASKMYPLKSTRHILARRFDIPTKCLDSVGYLAGSLIDLSVEWSRLSFSNSLKGSKRTIKLSEICQRNFLSEYRGILSHYGWEVDERFLSNQERITGLIRPSWADGDTKVNLSFRTKPGVAPPSIIPLLVDLLKDSWFDPKEFNLTRIIECAVCLTCEVLLSSCYTSTPKIRAQWLGDYGDIATSGFVLYRLILGSRSTFGVPPMEVSQFLSEALRIAIFESTQLNERHLACSNNGYIAYYRVLEQPSLDYREACEITVAPGTLRWGPAMSPFRRLEDYKHSASTPCSDTEVTSSGLIHLKKASISAWTYRLILITTSNPTYQLREIR